MTRTEENERTEQQLRHLHDSAASNDSNTQHLGYRILEALRISNIKLLHQRLVAFLQKHTSDVSANRFSVTSQTSPTLPINAIAGSLTNGGSFCVMAVMILKQGRVQSFETQTFSHFDLAIRQLDEADMAEWDLTRKIIPYVDRHLAIPLLESLLERSLFPQDELLLAQYELTKGTNMIDWTVKLFEQLYPDQEPPAGTLTALESREGETSRSEMRMKRAPGAKSRSLCLYWLDSMADLPIATYRTHRKTRASDRHA